MCCLMTSCKICLNGKESVKESFVVMKVGGCNGEGRCTVMYDDGKIGEEYMPVEGQKVQISVCK